MANPEKVALELDPLPNTPLGLVYLQRQAVIRDLERCLDQIRAEIARLRAENMDLCSEIAESP